jgi:hypothetical protein
MLEDDGDIVRALGFVTLYASYLEEQIEELIKLLDPIKKYTKGWQISDKIVHAKKTVRKLGDGQFKDLVDDLDTCLEIFLDRNELLHGRIYGGINRPDTLKSNREDIPDREVSSKELYKLANEMDDFRSAIYRPMIFKLPRAVGEFLN